MNLTVFQSDKGDCLMLASGNKRILIDGGMRDSYARHVAPTLSKLEKNCDVLDLVYVSHIDRDHVFGVLQMMEDLVAWRVYDFHRTAPSGNRNWPKPKAKRPPEIGAVWHNVFHELVGRNAGPIADMLAASAQAFSGFETGELMELSDGAADLTGLSDTFSNLTSSMADATELSRRVGPHQLAISVNKEFDGKLILRRDGQRPVHLGGMRIHVIGPSVSDLRKLRRKWNQWLRSEVGARQVRRIRGRHRGDEDVLGIGDIGDLLASRRARVKELGRRAKVTLPNLASLMLFVEKKGKTVMLTGDGHWKDILEGLEQIGKLKLNGGIHVNVLKVQHHGSEHNVALPFCKRVTADAYVFCGNGAHENPDLRVIDLFAKSRIGKADERSANQETANECVFWFNSSSTLHDRKTENLAHMRKVEKKMKDLSKRSHGRIKYRFLKSDKFEIKV